MQNKWKYAVLGAVIGTATTLTLAMPSIIPRAWAQEQPIKVLEDTKASTLKLFERDLDLFKPQWATEPSVSQEVISTHVVRKIEFGRTSFVQVVTTPTGVYSSDAIDSPNVRYPGVHRDPSREYDAVAYLSDGSWVGLKLRDAQSFNALVPLPDGGFTVIRQ